MTPSEPLLSLTDCRKVFMRHDTVLESGSK